MHSDGILGHMADQLSSVAGNSANIGAAKAAQEVQKMLMAKLLGSIEQAGQAQMQSPNRIDRVQISQQAQQLYDQSVSGPTGA